MLVKMQGNKTPYTLLGNMQPLYSSMALRIKTLYMYMTQQFCSRVDLPKKISTRSLENIYRDVHCSIICGRKALEVIQVSGTGTVERKNALEHSMTYYIAIRSSTSNVHVQNEWIVLQN